MAPSRGQSKTASKAQTRAHERIANAHISARSRRRKAQEPDHAVNVYDALIREAEDEDSRPPKRRRIGPDGIHSTTHIAQSENDEPVLPLQTVVDSDESDEDGMDWEEVGLEHGQPSTTEPDDVALADISIELGPKQTPRKQSIKRKPPTAAERLLRLGVHEAHVLFLLFHVHVRNAWCSLESVQSKLRSILPAKTKSFLHPNQDMIQFGRSESFMNGLKLAADLWSARFSVDSSGMHRAIWADNQAGLEDGIRLIHEEIPAVNKGEFIKAARSLSGSQDIGNQLFCALLRSVGLQARLVCSLQPLPFGAAISKINTPTKDRSAMATVYADGMSSADEVSAAGSASDAANKKTPLRRRRIGQPNFAFGGTSKPPPPPKRAQARPIRRLTYPIFWVEVFNDAYQKWVSVDPIVTGTINKPAKLEPPASYELCNMTYVVAFEQDGWARDVTRKYAKAFNAKTRKFRVESTTNGDRWYRKALKPFRRPSIRDRDQIEDMEMAKKEAQEGLPSNIQDFKDHPYYALERHLKRHEVILPKRQVGKVGTGKGSASKLEPVYRRSDVQIVRSADKWYRFGREIKPGEQPVKHVPARIPGGRHADDADDREPALTALYAYSQTELYVPPPVVNGRIPKNVFGNLDLYTPSMVPPGGAHIKHALAPRAAKLLGIDFAAAVTGFQFRGRQGTAVTDGVVIADEYSEAVQCVIEAFQDAVQEEEDNKRTLECLRLWKRFLTGLRIGERLGMYKDEHTLAVKPDVIRHKLDEEEDEHEETMGAGGFFPDTAAETKPTAGLFRASGPPRSLLSRATEAKDEDMDEHGADYDLDEGETTDVQESAPRLRRRRNIKLDSSDSDSSDEYVQAETTPVRALPVRRSTRSTRQGKVGSEQVIVTPASSRGTGSSREDLSEPDAAEDDALKDKDDVSGGGFMPEEVTEDAPNMADLEQDLEDIEQCDLLARQSPGVSDTGITPGDAVATGKLSAETPPIPEEDDTALYGGGFMVEDDTEDVALRSNVAEHAEHDVPDGNVERGKEVGEADYRADRPSLVAPDIPAQPNVVAPIAQEEHGDDAESTYEASLLSHDPEDDEAEPEWLNSD